MMQVAENFSFSREGSILKRVLKASRLHAAKALTKILNRIVTENSVPAWPLHFDLACKCFLKPRRGGKKAKSLASVVNCQIEDFTENKVITPKPSVKKKKSEESFKSGHHQSNIFYAVLYCYY